MSIATFLIGCLLQAQPVAPPDAPPAAWTILIYGAADNDADGHMLEFLNDVRGAVADDPRIELVLFIDRSKRYSTDAETLGEDFTGGRLYRLRQHTAERLSGGAQFPEMTLEGDVEVDSADPLVLEKFILFGKARFPALRTGLLIYSHADGISMCPDEESRTNMGIADFASKVSAQARVDWMALELCNMGGIEVAYEWRPRASGFSTDVLVAIPNAGPPLDWRRIFSRLHSPGHGPSTEMPKLDPDQLTAQEFGRIAIEEGYQGRLAQAQRAGAQGAHARHEAAACYDLTQVDAAKRAIDAFARAAAKDPAAKPAMQALLAPQSEPRLLNYVQGEFRSQRSFVDAHALLQRASTNERIASAARDAARAAAEAVDALVTASFGMSGYPGFEAGKHGIFIVFPDGDARVRNVLFKKPVWNSYRWYHPLPHQNPGELVGGWAWCRDGATAANGEVENWFELLDWWFDDTRKSARGSNDYAP